MVLDGVAADIGGCVCSDYRDRHRKGRPGSAGDASAVEEAESGGEWPAGKRHGERVTVLDVGQDRDSRSLSFRFDQILVELFGRVRVSVQQAIHGESAVQVDFGAGFKGLEAFFSRAWNVFA